MALINWPRDEKELTTKEILAFCFAKNRVQPDAFLMELAVPKLTPKDSPAETIEKVLAPDMFLIKNCETNFTLGIADHSEQEGLSKTFGGKNENSY